MKQSVPISSGDTYFYRVGSAEVHPGQGFVFVDGKEHVLRYQSFQVLLYLVEHSERVVTKDEIAEHVWRGASVTDNALVQCIADIRRALLDDPRSPKYIKTIPKVGYRVSVPCVRMVVPDIQRQEHAGRSNVNGAETEPSAHASAFLLRPPIILSGHPSQSGEGESFASTLVLSTEENVGRSSVPSHVLSQAAASPEMEKPPQGTRVRAIYWVFCAGVFLLITACILLFRTTRMEHSGGNNESQVPELSQAGFEDHTQMSNMEWLQEGFPAMFNATLAIVPGITTAGQRLEAVQIRGEASQAEHHQVRLMVRAVNRYGAIQAQDSEVVDGHEVDIESGILAAKIAQQLGVSPAPFDPAEELPVTTSSPEAYHYYSLGVQKAQAYETHDAEELLLKATALDSSFAMAYARIGYSYAVIDSLPEKGLPYLEHARTLAQKLPESDQLLIAAWTSIAQRDYAQAERTLTTLTTRYPKIIEAWWQLARILRSEERVELAVDMLHKAIAANPASAELYNTLGVVDLSLYRYQEAIAVCQQAIRLDPQDPNLKDSLGMAYEESGQYYAALAIYGLALSGDPEFEPALLHLGDTYYQAGRYHDAVVAYRHFISVAQSAHAQALGYSDLVAVYRAVGDFSAAAQASESERSLDPEAVADQMLLQAADHMPQMQALLFASKVEYGMITQSRGAPADLRTRTYLRGISATLYGDSSRALAEFQEAVHHLPPTSAVDTHEDCLAMAYLHFGMAPEAVQEFKRVLELNPRYPLARYHLAQSYASMHEAKKAADAYATFFAQSKFADQDGPQVSEARAALTFQTIDRRGNEKKIQSAPLH